jgi:glycerate kinase
MVRVLICPQEFKGSLNAEAAADAIAAGIRSARPDWALDLLPLADGGPGFVDALRRAVPCELIAVPIRDALGRRVVGRFLVFDRDNTVVIEAAQANGLMHLGPGELDALNTDTRGVGDLIIAALDVAPPRIIVGVGGSATTDGGAGMAQALGARLLDGNGEELPPGGAALRELARIEWRPPPALNGVDIVAATDVTNVLTGPAGAAHVFGPQKGASPDEVVVLDRALEHYAAQIREWLGVDIEHVPGAGAAGGLAAGLIAFLGARVASGFDVVAEATDLTARLEQADIVATGEGRFDSQTGSGKGPGRVLAMARDAGKRTALFAGVADSVPEGTDMVTLASRARSASESMREAARLLREAAREWADGQTS